MCHRVLWQMCVQTRRTLGGCFECFSVSQTTRSTEVSSSAFELVGENIARPCLCTNFHACGVYERGWVVGGCDVSCVVTLPIPDVGLRRTTGRVCGRPADVTSKEEGHTLLIFFDVVKLFVLCYVRSNAPQLCVQWHRITVVFQTFLHCRCFL